MPISLLLCVVTAVVVAATITIIDDYRNPVRMMPVQRFIDNALLFITAFIVLVSFMVLGLLLITFVLSAVSPAT